MSSDDHVAGPHVRFRLLGEPIDLMILRTAFPSGEVVVGGDGESTYLTGSNFDSLPPGEARLLAEETLHRLNGVGRLIASDFAPVTLAPPPGLFMSGRGHMSLGGEESLARRAMTRAVESARFDEALRIIGASPDLGWSDLYKVFELLRADAGSTDEAFRQRVNISRQQLSAFTASANRPDVSGREARHAVLSGAPPSTTMTLEEGRALIIGILQRW